MHQDQVLEADSDGVLGFFAARWQGLVALKRLFWLDMITVGTMINIVTSLASVLTLAGGAPLWLSLSIFFSPLPYNLFLFGSVWRTAETAEPNTRFAARFVGACWLIAATLI